MIFRNGRSFAPDTEVSNGNKTGLYYTADTIIELNADRHTGTIVDTFKKMKNIPSL